MDIYEQLRRDEGVLQFPYLDTVGKTTIGVGRNLTDRGLSNAEVDYLLQNDVLIVRSQLRPFSWYSGLDPVRQGALENLCFNIGLSSLLHFPSMLHALSIQDWKGAHDQALDSEWAHQVGERATRIAVQLLLGEWQ